MLNSGDLDFSFSGLKTAVLTAARDHALDGTQRADLAAEFQEAAVDVLVAKALAALAQCGLNSLVVAGGVGANRRLRDRLDRATQGRGCRVHYPEFELCTDNGAMIALAGALRLEAATSAGKSATPQSGSFSVRPRWPLDTLSEPGAAA
ncbi:MAG: tRNA (adenosine(37)-N6)-threonylcarbamoyltransferase complex transferase subunit TsaD, partial [Rhodocyclaceae bacterium]